MEGRLNYTCQCGAVYTVTDALLGQVVKCPRCGTTGRVKPPPPPPQKSSYDLLFSRHQFLLHDKEYSKSGRYEIWDEHGEKLLIMERPRRRLRKIWAFLVATLVVSGLLAAFFHFKHTIPLPMEGITPWSILTALLITIFLMVFIRFHPYEYLTITKDDTQTKPIFFLRQNHKVRFMNRGYTIEEPNGQILATINKNSLFNIFSHQWIIRRSDERIWAVAKEESFWRSFFRHLLGPFSGMISTNFLIIHRDSKEIIGNFSPIPDVFNRYALDMTADKNFTLDRRVALGLGIVLDLSE